MDEAGDVLAGEGVAPNADVEYGIAEVARLAGTTSRTLRHYGDVGLLEPSRIGANGYRYYDTAALTRLQRILMLRQLGLGVAAIAEVLDATDDTSALRAHLEWLRAESERLDRQIASVERTITSIEKGGTDHGRATCSTGSTTRSTRRRSSSAGAPRPTPTATAGGAGSAPRASRRSRTSTPRSPRRGRSCRQRVRRSTARRPRPWPGATTPGSPPAGATSRPSADQLAGLADMYVADERFAANYGGPQGATYVRDALTHFAITELA